MIKFNSFELNNGLKVFVHEDTSTPIAAFNLCYNVGSRDESPNKTGFAHLFEHLMFGGSVNIPDYDIPLQKIGAQNNAFTNTDITNYYITLPVQNIETAFWIESDRMNALDFSQSVLDIQKSVVIEEFKQRYLNQPYGDAWLKLRPLAYKTHPYQWATIGKEISHIENASLDDVKDFFYRFYLPNNAVLVIGGNVKTAEMEVLAQKWFGDIKPGKVGAKNLPTESKQTASRFLKTNAKVPSNVIYKAFHMPAKYKEGYFEADLLSDVLGRGKSARLNQELVIKNKIFNNISASINGTLDPGLFIINGFLAEGVDFETGEKAIQDVINEIKSKEINNDELQKIKNQAIASDGFGEIDLLNRVYKIAMGAISGDAELCNKEMEYLRQVSTSGILKAANNILNFENCSTLHYHSN